MSGPGSELREGVGSSPLAAGLRELRGRTGLSLAGLAARTPYSKSSWERYLNGKKLPPRDAVEALCRLAEEPAGRLLALWELADADWSGRGRSDTSQGRGAAEATRRGPAEGTANAPGSAFNEPSATNPDGGTAGQVYAGNGQTTQTPANGHAVSQYDVACFQVSQSH